MPACATTSATDLSGTGRQRVLIVEDDSSSRDAMTRLLRLRGLDVQAAANLAEAFECLAWRPSSLILDLMLPDGIGTALLAHIRNQGLPIRVAVVTAVGDQAILDEVKRLRPDLLMIKPVDVGRLVTWLVKG